MDLKGYFDKMKTIENQILQLINDNDAEQETFTKLITLFEDSKISENKHELESVLYLLLKIANNYHRSANFFLKIDQILLFFKNEILKYYTNEEIYHFFKRNKRILLFLIENKILILDASIGDRMADQSDYLNYFMPQLKPIVPISFKDEFLLYVKELAGNFGDKQKAGENDSLICELIRKDSIDDFIIYIHKNNISLNSEIKPSIFETNQFLVGRDTSLFEYAAFYGSIQIFNYLRFNKIEMTPSLWIYAIHGNNYEIIQLLEENKIIPKDETYNECLKEALKCHNYEVTDYLLTNYLDGYNEFAITHFIKYYNFQYLKEEYINQSFFYDFCHYKYFLVVENLLKSGTIDINAKTINNIFFLNTIL